MFRRRERAIDEARAGMVTAIIAYALEIPLEEVQAEGRGSAEAAFARQVAMYLAHVALEMSLARIAAAFGRDRSTVSHACHLVEDRRDDPAFEDWIDQLEASIRAAPAPVIGRLAGPASGEAA